MSNLVTISRDKKERKKVKTCVNRRRQEFEGENDGEDIISTLPDEVIALILSLLTVREMVCTSVLSSRWRYIWTYACNLDFNSTKILHALELNPRKRMRIRDVQNYINMVNRVLSSIQARSVDSLRIRFDLGISHHNYKADIKKWIGFAIEKRVKRLDMDMSSVKMFPRLDNSYPFHRSDFESLVVLRLASFHITGVTLENIMLNCQLLECLSVRNSSRLVNLKVTSKSLQYLEIRRCTFMEEIEVNAENLRTLKYYGWKINLALNYAPRLVELYFGEWFCKFFLSNIPQFSGHLSRLETLGVDISRYEESKIYQLPVLGNIKQLEVRIGAMDQGSLSGLISLLKKFPFLQKLSFWLSCWPGKDREVMEAEKLHHDHLKVVEFHGFNGHSIDIELTTYFLENAVALEKIIIDRATINIHRLDRAVNFRENKEKISARKQARLLAKRLRPGHTMVIQ